MTLVSRPVGKSALTGVTTQGVNGTVVIPTEADFPYIAPTQVKIYVSAKAYVALGDSSTADTTVPDNAVIQQAQTEEVYTLTGIADVEFDYLWVYSVSSTIDADVSFFG
jgi:hypothetical protein